MYTLLFLLVVSETLNMTWLQTGVSIATIALVIIGTVWRVNRANKADLVKEITKKADAEVVKRDFQTRDEKIHTIDVKLTEHEKHNDSQYNNLKEGIEELNANISHIHNRVDKIYEKLTK